MDAMDATRKVAGEEEGGGIGEAFGSWSSGVCGSPCSATAAAAATSTAVPLRSKEEGRTEARRGDGRRWREERAEVDDKGCEEEGPGRGQ